MLIDVHCHANLYLSLNEVLKEAKIAGIEKIIGVSMSYTSLERILELSNQFEVLYPALGIHPQEVEENSNIDQQLESAIEIIRKNNQKICAIGEIGLDHHFVKDLQTNFNCL